MRQYEPHTLKQTSAYSWGGDEFQIRTTGPRTVLFLPCKGKLSHQGSIKPQWDLLYSAASNMTSILRQDGHPELPVLHTRHIVEIVTERPGDDSPWGLLCTLPPTPKLDDWRPAVDEDEIAFELKCMSGLKVDRLDSATCLETQCDSPAPFNGDDVRRVLQFCSENVLSLGGRWTWLCDFDAYTGAFGLSIMRAPVRKNSGMGEAE